MSFKSIRISFSSSLFPIKYLKMDWQKMHLSRHWKESSSLSCIAFGELIRNLAVFPLRPMSPMKTTCSSREGEVHFKYNTLRRYIKNEEVYFNCNTWNLSPLFFLYFSFQSIFICFSFFTLEVHPFIFGFWTKIFTLETHVSLLV